MKNVWRVWKGKGKFGVNGGSVNSNGQHQSTFRVFRAKLAFWCLSLNCQPVAVFASYKRYFQNKCSALISLDARMGMEEHTV